MCKRSKSPLQFQFFPTTCQPRNKIYMPNTPTISLWKDSANIVPTCKLIRKLKNNIHQNLKYLISTTGQTFELKMEPHTL